jgi:protein PsiE
MAHSDDTGSMSAAKDQSTAKSSLPAREEIAPRGFLWLERFLLAVITLLTLAAAGLEVIRVIDERTVALADILLMFLYLEVIAMISVFYSGKRSPFVYPIVIAITALARLIVLQGKDMEPENILYEATAILILAGAAVVVMKTRRLG